jgi:aspartate racemase
MARMLDLIAANNLEDVTAYLLSEIHKLARAGADFALLASNTPHVVFDTLQLQSPIPLISIVEVTCRAAEKKGLKRVGIFGTRFTMQGRFYPEVFEKAEIALVLPEPEEQIYIHDKYMGELVHGIIRPETRTTLLDIVERMKTKEKIDGMILGGTELPLILRDSAELDIPFLDTTKLHVESVVSWLLQNSEYQSFAADYQPI